MATSSVDRLPEGRTSSVTAPTHFYIWHRLHRPRQKQYRRHDWRDHLLLPERIPNHYAAACRAHAERDYIAVALPPARRVLRIMPPFYLTVGFILLLASLHVLSEPISAGSFAAFPLSWVTTG